MLRPTALAVVILGTFVAAASAQKVKVDSLFVHVPHPKTAAIDLVLTAFAAQRLDVTDNSGSLITSDLGSKMNGFTRVKYTRVVRALVVASDSMTTNVLITGIETREDATSGIRRIRIDNKADHDSGVVWCQMVRVAMSLDSAQVSPDARASEACKKKN